VSVKKTVSIVAMSVCNITSSKIKEDSPKNDPKKKKEDRNRVTYVSKNATSSHNTILFDTRSCHNIHVATIRLKSTT
jgi:hypothetical protein